MELTGRKNVHLALSQLKNKMLYNLPQKLIATKISYAKYSSCQ